MDILTATLNEPDVRAGRLHYRIFQGLGKGQEVLLARVLRPSGVAADELDELEEDEAKEGELFTRAFPTLGAAVDALEQDSVEQGAWYGQPEWLRKPDFELRIMVPPVS